MSERKQNINSEGENQKHIYGQNKEYDKKSPFDFYV